MLCQIGRAVCAQNIGQAHTMGHVRLQRVEQFQWRSGAGQATLRQMEIAQGGRDVTMTQQALDGVEVHAGFE